MKGNCIWRRLASQIIDERQLYLEEDDWRDDASGVNKLAKAGSVGIVVPILEAYDGMGGWSLGEGF